ncbi:hypothetical protein K431DRAFT_341436 [Polychaeton citri CBS 116435]|uniref:Protein scd2/ral3 n=1 Tax=Polychaeton citri CBS 116435 TaxID=1314669 RepID=A0A9P4Q2N6_9PEZI|nr:hypothetical protein K431DRAFT_341436 [Polychaeton citri CBS 116435]
MVKFRRSIKSDSKHDSARPAQVSIPQKDAIAIEPPKKVIKALYNYVPPAGPSQDQYLAFSAGDFLYVTSRENDRDWYEACNPSHGTRGLVPVKYFEGIGKTVRDSAGSSRSASVTHDSGYAEGSSTGGPLHSHKQSTNGVTSPDSSNGASGPAIGHRSTKSFGKTGGVYGIVAYDFQAERPDELDAKEGEAIIVIAQSNPEWFVAKPITRLGGPGLIPVSFIEIRDMTTGLPVPDPSEAVAQAGIPRVEEWKKMAAEYKNTSIPLGTVSSSTQAGNIQQSMERMSLSNQQVPQNGNGGHQRQPSGYDLQAQQRQNLFAPARASVPRYIFADEKFHFVVECKLSNGTHWDLSRIYEDFYELQINLINAFQEEAGQVPGKPRILPYMPGPVKFVTDNISEGRRANLNDYLRDLLQLQPHITCSSLVRNFFAPRPGDYEIDPNEVELDGHARAHDAGQRTSAVSQISWQQGQPGPDAGAWSQQQQPSNPQMHQSSHRQPGHYRSPSEFTQQSQSTLQPQGTSQTTANSQASGAPVKVKAWFDRDTCVVIRMPPRGSFGFDELYRKIVERRRLEYRTQQQSEEADDQLEIEYRDESQGDYYRLEGDEDLDIALERNEKLTLAVRAADS